MSSGDDSLLSEKERTHPIANGKMKMPHTIVNPSRRRIVLDGPYRRKRPLGEKACETFAGLLDFPNVCQSVLP